jgi:hypothetical protein
MSGRRSHLYGSGKSLPTVIMKRESLMNTPNKAVEAHVPAQNADKTNGNSDNKTTAPTPEKKVEAASPASLGSVK